MARVLVPLVAALCLFSAGCASAPDANVQGTDTPVVVEDPNDYSYLENASASERPHIHDYWGGQTQLTLAEGPMTWSGSNVAGTASTFGGGELKIPDGQTVIPGTRWVNVTATWKNERPSTVDFLVEYQTANGTKGTIKVPSGETVSIEVTEEMNDLAHARQSRWAFRPLAAGSGPAWSAEIKAQVRVDIAKTPGPLPFAPAHVDAWGANRSLVLHDTSGRLVEPSNEKTERPTSAPVLAPVPLDTARVWVRFYYNSSTPTAFHYDPVLDYRGADRTTYNEAGKAKERQARNTNGFLAWELEVKPEMWDSPYATVSDWRMTIFWGGDVGMSKTTQGANLMQGDFHLVITAERA